MTMTVSRDRYSALASPHKTATSVLFAWLRQLLAARRDSQLLQSMSEAQLKDIGLSRSDIDRAIRDGHL